MKNRCLLLVILLGLFLYPVTAFAGTWSTMTSGTTLPLNGIWGTSETNIYVVGGGYLAE